MAPPRNRRRKKGLMRIDAALAAMRPMGFSDSVVRKCVKNLLKVYGDGDEGWYFIEEGSYKLLIDTILEGEVLPEPQRNQLPDEAGDRVGNDADASSEQLGSLSIQFDKQDSRDKSTVQNGCLSEIDDKHKPQEKDFQFTRLQSRPLKDDICPAQPGPQLEFAPLPSLIIMDRVSTKKIRKPCYGWISDDDDDDDDNDYDDFILLPPANGANPS